MPEVKRKSEVAVLSDGAWGTAIALTLMDNNCNVRLWGPFPENICEIRRNGENIRFLPGVAIPQELGLCENIEEAAEDAEFIVLASPSQFLRGTLEKFKTRHDPEKHVLINLAKGIETDTLKRMSELCSEILGRCRYCVLSGPSHAEEVSRKLATAVVIASKNEEISRIAQNLLMNKYFRVYTSDDVAGVELCGSLKNIFAIAAGMIDGIGLGDNAKAAMITRGSVEMGRLGKELGGKSHTFSGLSGIGDLVVTCYSRHSRNRHVGEELGKGRKIQDVLKEMGLAVAEGVKTTESAAELAKKHGVETPIINEMHEIIFNGKNPRKALEDLMNRKPRKEME